jgi:hypothetical protein
VVVRGANDVAVIALGDILSATLAVFDPVSVAFDPANGLLFVATGTGDLSVREGATAVATVGLRQDPGRHVWEPVSHLAFVAADVSFSNLDPRTILGTSGRAFEGSENPVRRRVCRAIRPGAASGNRSQSDRAGSGSAPTGRRTLRPVPIAVRMRRKSVEKSASMPPFARLLLAGLIVEYLLSSNGGPTPGARTMMLGQVELEAIGRAAAMAAAHAAASMQAMVSLKAMQATGAAASKLSAGHLMAVKAAAANALLAAKLIAAKAALAKAAVFQATIAKAALAKSAAVHVAAVKVAAVKAYAPSAALMKSAAVKAASAKAAVAQVAATKLALSHVAAVKAAGTHAAALKISAAKVAAV